MVQVKSSVFERVNSIYNSVLLTFISVPITANNRFLLVSYHESIPVDTEQQAYLDVHKVQSSAELCRFLVWSKFVKSDKVWSAPCARFYQYGPFCMGNGPLSDDWELLSVRPRISLCTNAGIKYRSGNCCRETYWTYFKFWSHKKSWKLGRLLGRPPLFMQMILIC